jgi:hypothetical protein
MQISGASLALTWPCRLCLLRFLLCLSLCYKLSPFQALGKVTLHPCCQACVFINSSCGRWVPPLLCSFPPTTTLHAFLLLIPGRCCCSCQLPCLFTVHVGSGSSLLSCGVFIPPPLSQVFPLLVAGCAPLLPPEAFRPGQLVYLQSWEGFPSPNLWRSVCPTLFPMCLYCSYCLLFSFSFFPGVEVSLSRWLYCSGPGLSVGVSWYHEAHLVCIFPSCLVVLDSGQFLIVVLVGVYCSIDKGSYSISNTSFLNSPPPQFSFISSFCHWRNSFNRYLFFHLHSCVHSICAIIIPLLQFCTSSPSH